MLDVISLARTIKEYIQNEGRTLAVSQGKMLKDCEINFALKQEKQTA